MRRIFLATYVIVLILLLACSEKTNPDDKIDTVARVERKTIIDKPSTEGKTTTQGHTTYTQNFNKGVESIVVYQYTGTGVNMFVLDEAPRIEQGWVIFWIEGKKHWITGNIEIVETAKQ